MLLLRVAADIGERQNDDRQARRGGFFGRWGRRGLRVGGRADLERIDPDRLGDVLELCRAEIGDGEIEPPLHLAIGVLGQTDRARLGDALQPRGDIDAVAHQIAVALLDDVAEMNADAKLDAALGRQAGVAFDHAVLHFDRAAHGVDDAAELDQAAVAGALDDASVMRGDGRDRSDRCAARAAATGCDPRPRPRAGCIRRHPRPGSPRSSAFRSLRLSVPPRTSTRPIRSCGISGPGSSVRGRRPKPSADRLVWIDLRRSLGSCQIGRQSAPTFPA